MKKLLILSIGLFIFGTSQAIQKKNKKSRPKVVRIIPQGTNDGFKTYAVTLSDGTSFEYMYMSEIKEAKRTGIWKYEETLEFNKK
jgi:hypothetical protein